MFTLEMLPANEGDALWIEYGPGQPGDGGAVHRVLIDCGRKQAYRAVVDRLGDGVRFDLFVLTHVDADHIEGAVPLLQDPRFRPEDVGDVWFNEYRHLKGESVEPEPEPEPGAPRDRLGAQQGEYFAALLRDRGFGWNRAFSGGPVEVPAAGTLPERTLPGGMRLTLLSPTREKLEAMRLRWDDDLLATRAEKRIQPGDYQAALEVLTRERALASDGLGRDQSWPPDLAALARTRLGTDAAEPNGSSIALLAEYDHKTVLLTGDAHAPVLVDSLRRLLRQRRMARLPLQAMKLSHHGSLKNISEDLLGLVSCSRFLVSTDGSRHGHPDADAIACVIRHGGKDPELVFNYAGPLQKRWSEQGLPGRLGYTTRYAPGTDGFIQIVL